MPTIVMMRMASPPWVVPTRPRARPCVPPDRTTKPSVRRCVPGAGGNCEVVHTRAHLVVLLPVVVWSRGCDTCGLRQQETLAYYKEMGGSGMVDTKIANRETEYHKRRLARELSPERGDAFSGDTPARSYKDIMAEQTLKNEKEQVMRKIAKKAEEAAAAGTTLSAVTAAPAAPEKRTAAAAPESATPRRRKRRRWDDAGASGSGSGSGTATATALDDGATPVVAPGRSSRWDATPDVASGGSGSGSSAATPRRKNRWDETPVAASGQSWAETPVVGSGGAAGGGQKRSRWDETPEVASGGLGGVGGTTPMLSAAQMTPELANRLRWEREIAERNRPLTDEDLDAMFPPGYKILEPPATYVPLRTPSRKLLATPTPMSTPGFMLGQTPARDSYGISVLPESSGNEDLPFVKEEDYRHFGKLMEEVDESTLSNEEMKERKIMRLLLRIKNGTPPQRKSALRQLTDKTREFGAGPLFNQVLPLLMSPTLEDQERHLLVKVIDRIMYKLDDLVRPYVHKILIVIEPLLIDEDYYARVEGREIISNLAKAAGLATMISSMRPDIDDTDEYVRNTTARAFAVVASALGIPALLPFLGAVCKSRRLWQARHTGIKIVQQIAILMGCAVLPHLKHLVEIITHGLQDEQPKVKTITALAIAALAEAAHPYGIESFDPVLQALWKGVRQLSGKALAAYLKAIGFLIPLMDAQYASYFTKNVMVVLIREFSSPDEEMKKIVLKVVEQCVGTEGVVAEYVREEILPEFMKNFWVRRNALDRRNYHALVNCTVELANKVGASDIIKRIVDDLKDESEPYVGPLVV